MHFGFGGIRQMVNGLVRYMVKKNFYTIYDFLGKTLRVNRGKSCPAYF
jgi:hypothetical protein